uniref:Pleckstrin homology domain-containing family J member 1 n=1 Tax=Lygus hesperus TaxID=30085 RepID=A0A0K8SNG6_LYGHE
MRFNERQVCLLAQQIPDLEDRLYLKKKCPGSFKKEVFKHRWFRLKYNMLFYFKIADTGQVSEEPDGVIFLADCTARTEYDGGAPFTFSLTFGGTFDKILILATRDQEALSKWIAAINNASYDLLRQRVRLLRQQLAFARS